MQLEVPPPRTSCLGSPPGLSRVHWVRPELVAEVKFLTWTDDNLLREVVYEGLREDKPAAEVRRPMLPQGALSRAEEEHSSPTRQLRAGQSLHRAMASAALPTGIVRPQPHGKPCKHPNAAPKRRNYPVPSPVRSAEPTRGVVLFTGVSGHPGRGEGCQRGSPFSRIPAGEDHRPSSDERSRQARQFR
jgi:hypothetical protein